MLATRDLPSLQHYEGFTTSFVLRFCRLKALRFAYFSPKVSPVQKVNELTFYCETTGYVYYSMYCDDGRAKATTKHTAVKAEFDEGNIDKTLQKLITRLRYLVDQYTTAQRLALKPVTKKDVKAIINKELGKKDKADVVSGVEVFRKFYTRALDGTIKNYKGKPYGRSSMAQFKQVLTTLEGYGPAKKPVNEWDVDFMEGFTTLLTNKKRVKKTTKDDNPRYSQNTIFHYQTHLIRFLKQTRKLKWHDNNLGSEEGIRVASEELDYAVYCTPEELKAIAEVKVKTRLQQKCKDYFLFGAHTGLRYIDIGQEIKRKGNFLIKNTEKTDTTVYIPLHPVAEEIWERYGGNLYVHDTTLRGNLTMIAQKAGLVEPVLFMRTEGGVMKKEWVPKYELISTHSMRRSWATNAYKAGVPIKLIMAVGGWKTETQLVKYLRLSQQELAEEAAAHEYFRGG